MRKAGMQEGVIRGVSFEVIDHPRYRYRLTHAYHHVLEHHEPLVKYRARIETDDIRWVDLCGEGLLYVARGYAFDGPSGPAIDTMNMARASLVHDVGLQLIAEGELPIKPWKRHFDREFLRIMREDGVPAWRAWYCYIAVRLFGRGRDRFKPEGL